MPGQCASPRPDFDDMSIRRRHDGVSDPGAYGRVAQEVLSEPGARLAGRHALQCREIRKPASGVRCLSPHRNGWGESAKPVAGLSPKVRNFLLPLTLESCPAFLIK